MIAWIRFALTAALVAAGLIILCIGVFGVFRFHYAANRMHASALNDTLGLAVSAPDGFTAAKIVLVVVFMWISSPVASHLLCRLEVETNEDREQYMTVRDSLTQAQPKEGEQ